MKNFSLKLISAIIIITSSFSIAYAATVYLPTSTSDQYLPTVKIHTFDLDSSGNLVPYSLGSGTLIDDKGTILTNNHVVQDEYDTTKTYDAFQICLSKANDPENPVCQFTASIIARNPSIDLALLKMDNTDATGAKVDFNFYIPYKNDIKSEVGDKLTVLGYPDTGGKTLTVTSGIISGFLDINNIKYIKTDADISFGNSGGTGLDEKGNLIGVPTYVSSSNSAESLGYLLPITEGDDWIDENIKTEASPNEEAQAKLSSEMKKFIDANEKGTYTNDYPVYTISTIDGWKFGNSLEGAFDDQNSSYSPSSNSISIYPEDTTDSSYLSMVIFTKNFGYEITTDDIMSYTKQYQETYYADNSDGSYSYEKVKLNDKYDAVMETESYVDYYSDSSPTVTMIAYNIPYGDEIVRIAYTYASSDEAKLADVDKILATLNIDMSKISFEPTYSVTNDDPYYQVNLPEDLRTDFYMQKTDYGTYVNKKADSSFYFYFTDSLLSGSFDDFIKSTESDVKTYGGDIRSSGTVTIDGINGKYITEDYTYDGETSTYTNIYLNLGDSYLEISYSETNQDKYMDNLNLFDEVLKNIKLSNQGQGQYKIPDFSKNNSKNLIDIKNYIYEDFIKHLDSDDIFGTGNVPLFSPERTLTRKDFIIWTVKSYLTFNTDDFDTFEKSYAGCKEDCFADVNYDDKDSIYIAYAKDKGAVSGIEMDGKKYLNVDDQISLMAALKIAFTIYEYDIWQAPSYIPWYIPYLQLGYKENIMPYGLQSIDYMLSRGEGAYMIDLLMRKNNDDYDDDYYDALVPEEGSAKI